MQCAGVYDYIRRTVIGFIL